MISIAFSNNSIARPSLVPLSVPDADAVSIADLSVAYGCNTVLKRVTLSIRRGGITALIGPSGCGKTSLLLAINRLLDLVPRARVEGSIHIDGEDVLASGVDVRALRKRVGMVFQRPNPFPFSIRRNLELVLDEAGIDCRSTRERKMEECMRSVGLLDECSGRLDKPATELSGGQQQRLCIARALITSPEVLLLDEPCSALDPISTMTIEKLLASMKEWMTLVIVTHNLAQARRVADHCALFWTRDGCGFLLEHQPKAQLFERPQHELTAAYVSGALA